MIEIYKPVYDGNNPENRKIGLAEYRLRNEPEIVEILIRHKRSKSHGGGYIYPGKYYISKKEIAKYPLEDVKTRHGYIPMYIIPIVALRRAEDDLHKEQKPVINVTMNITAKTLRLL